VIFPWSSQVAKITGMSHHATSNFCKPLFPHANVHFGVVIRIKWACVPTAFDSVPHVSFICRLCSQLLLWLVLALARAHCFDLLKTWGSLLPLHT
jgi:hypothetical protein